VIEVKADNVKDCDGIIVRNAFPAIVTDKTDEGEIHVAFKL
jgi:hypothetical protein